MLPCKSSEVVFQPVADGAVLLHSATEVYFGLNAVGSRIWNLLPPECATRDELCARLSAEFPDADAAMIREDVDELLAELERYELVSPQQENDAIPVERQEAAAQ